MGAASATARFKYLLGVLIPWIIRDVEGKEHVWQKIPRLPSFVTWMTCPVVSRNVAQIQQIEGWG